MFLPRRKPPQQQAQGIGQLMPQRIGGCQRGGQTGLLVKGLLVLLGHAVSFRRADGSVDQRMEDHLLRLMGLKPPSVAKVPKYLTNLRKIA